MLQHLKNKPKMGKTKITPFDKTTNLKVLRFQSANKSWFVCACRRGEPLNQNYDIIYGNVADDDVFRTIDMHFLSK